jgi:DNA-binding SARP family transcriptional activator
MERRLSTMRLDLAGERGPALDPVPERLSLHLFASFKVVRGGQALNGRVGGKARQLLKVLAANSGRGTTRDAIIETLWPESDPATSLNSLKVTVHNLRSALEPDKENGSPGAFVVAQDRSYRLSPEAEIWIDVESFLHHYRQARSYEQQGEVQMAERHYRRAEELYLGDYLEEDMYEEWTILRREELKDIYLDILGKLAAMSYKSKAHADAIRYCHKIVHADPCREDAYRMLMRSHGALNQLARAGAWYAVCRTKLAREVGSPPSNETVRVFEGLFDQVA